MAASETSSDAGGSRARQRQHRELFSGRGRLFRWVESAWESVAKVEAKVLQSHSSGTYKLWVRESRVKPTNLILYHPIAPEDSLSTDGRSVYFTCAVYNQAEGTLATTKSRFGLRFKTDQLFRAFVSAHEAAVAATAARASPGSARAPPAPHGTMPAVEEGDETVASSERSPARPRGDPPAPPSPGPGSPQHAKATGSITPQSQQETTAEPFSADKALEVVFGRSFNSIGGKHTAALTVQHLAPLPPSAHVLDIGCGIGGSTFYIARTLGCSVTGLSDRAEQLDLARQRAGEPGATGLKVDFELMHLDQAQFPNNSFDAIHCREATLGLRSRRAVLQKLSAWLKPGGKLVLADFCLAAGEGAKDYAAFCAVNSINPSTKDDLARGLQDAGLAVQVQDESGRYAGYLEADLATLAQHKDELATALTGKGVNLLRTEWEARLDHLRREGNMWVVAVATAAPAKQQPSDESAKAIPEDATPEPELAAETPQRSLLGTVLTVTAVGLAVGTAVLVAQNRQDRRGRVRSWPEAARAAARQVGTFVTSFGR